MKAYRLELLVLDFENYGEEELKMMAMNARGLDPTVMAIEGREIGEWDDNHPLNKRDTAQAEFKRLFGTPSNQPSLRADIDKETLYKLLYAFAGEVEGSNRFGSNGGEDTARKAIVDFMTAHTTRAVEAAVAAECEDAERYRWLNDQGATFYTDDGERHHVCEWAMNDVIDKAIAAATNKEKA